MTNEEIARLLETVAELYEIAGENPFKSRAYLRAAQTIRMLPQDVRTIAEDSGLEKIPGVGRSIALQIEQYLEHGTMPVLEELKSRIPIGVLELTKIPHVGPKTARILYENFGIKNIEDLKKALKEGVLREARGISSKTLGKIKKALFSVDFKQERMLLSEADFLAKRVTSFMKKDFPSVKVIAAGSLRRGMESVGDLDFVVCGASAKEALEAFKEKYGSEGLLVSGEEVFRVLGKGGIQYDFLITTEKRLGAALLHLTGSQAHNIRLRRIAKEMGCKLTQEGIHAPDGTLIEFETEEEVYRFLNLSFIPPELREDNGEIEAALEGRLPRLVEEGDIRGDLHVHSDWSDSSATLEEIADIGYHMGYEYIAVADHAKKLAVARGLTLEKLEARNRAIDVINRKYGSRFRLLKAIELNIDANGNVDFPPEILSEFDFCIASLHWSLSQGREAMTERLIRAMRNPFVDAIGHPTARLLFKRPEADIDFERVFEEASRTGTLFEINCFPDRLDLPPRLIRMAREFGVKFFLGTDAHSVSHLALIKYGLKTARRGWATREDIMNSLPLKDLEEELRARRKERMKIYGRK